MADTKISGLTALTAPSLDDLLAVVDDPAGTPVTKKSTVGQVAASMHPTCRVKKTTGTTINDATDTDLDFASEDWDDAAFWDAGAPSRLTIPTTGTYLVVMHSDWDTNTTGNRYIHIRLNGTTNIVAVTQGGSPGDARQCISLVYKFTAADYLQMRVFQNSGGSRTLDTFSAEIVRLA